MAKQVKRKRRTKERRNISISLPTETIEDLDELAELIGKRIGGIHISRSGAVTIAAHNTLEREKASPKRHGSLPETGRRPVGRPRKPVQVASGPPPAPRLWDGKDVDVGKPIPPDVIVDGKED